ncbi:MAG: PRC-barrel domain-containing protein [Corynebacterium sp.]|uniref:PRC-barrel domain-containing protein n=1 Tax=Corynebacterium sp. TaxID=1720 RepID=UPI0026DF5967|nr:PRC-barrel domain-containing protein [Corynebacterium sp.]MDO5669340.1 PRC-barrel domain-containing protein [Corynebacterium sp.]
MNRNIQDLTTATAYDRDGEKLGSVKEVYVNDSTGQPDFVEVGHGLFGMSSSIVPLRGHRLDGENLQLAFSKDRIQDAPNISDDAHLSEEDHATIYRHFGLDGTPNETEYEPHRFDDDRREADLQRDGVEPTAAQGMPGDQVVAPGVATGAAGVAEGTDVHGFGDHRPTGDHSADRLRAESDHELGLDRTPEDRAARGTSAHGMSDEPREQLRDYETGERDHADDAHLDRDRDGDRERHEERDLRPGETRLRKYRVRTTETVEVPVEREEVHVERGEDLTADQDHSLREQHDPRDLGNVDADGRPLGDGDQPIPRSNY